MRMALPLCVQFLFGAMRTACERMKMSETKGGEDGDDDDDVG